MASPTRPSRTIPSRPWPTVRSDGSTASKPSTSDTPSARYVRKIAATYTITWAGTRPRDRRKRVTTMADGLMLSTRASASRPSSTGRALRRVRDARRVRAGHLPGAVLPDPHAREAEPPLERPPVVRARLDRRAGDEARVAMDARDHVLVGDRLVRAGARAQLVEVDALVLDPAVRVREQPVVHEQTVERLDVGLQAQGVPRGVDREEVLQGGRNGWSENGRGRPAAEKQDSQECEVTAPAGRLSDSQVQRRHSDRSLG